MPVYFGSEKCMSAKHYQEEYAKEISMRPDSPHMDSMGFGKANSYINPRGIAPGIGWVLLTAKQLNTLIATGADEYALEFSDTTGRIYLPGMIIEDAQAVAYPATLDPPEETLYLVQFRDRRYLAKYHNLHVRFNVPNPEYPGISYLQDSTASPETHQVNTWIDILQHVWNEIPELGLFPGVPPGVTLAKKPHDIQALGVPAMDFLAVILKHLALELVFDASNSSFSIVVIASEPTPTFDNLVAQHLNKRIADRSPQGWAYSHAYLPEKLYIYYPKRGWEYGRSQHEPTTDDAWRIQPFYVLERTIDDPATISGSSFPIHDPMTAIYSQDARIMNLCDLEDRADELVEMIKRSYSVNNRKVFMTFSGHTNNDFKPDDYLSAVRIYDIGNGVKTDIVRRQTAISNPEVDWNLTTDKGFQDLIEENFQPPDLHRDQPPYSRVVHGTLLTPLTPYGFASAMVMWKPHQTYSVGQIPCYTSPSQCDWQLHPAFPGQTSRNPQVSHCDGGPIPPSGVVYPTPYDWEETGQIIINVHDYHGHYIDAWTRITAMYHWQSGTWVVIHASVPEFHGALLSRSGQLYQFIEVEFTGGGNSTTRPEGRCGYAIHINAQSHNSQGGIHPEVVRIYRAAGNGAPGADWIFEYSVAPFELPGERYEYQLGDFWDINNAPDCTKGVTLELIAVGSPGSPGSPGGP